MLIKSLLKNAPKIINNKPNKMPAIISLKIFDIFILLLS